MRTEWTPEQVSPTEPGYPDDYRTYTTRIEAPGGIWIIDTRDGRTRSVCHIERRAQWDKFCAALDAGADEVAAVHAIDV